MTREHTIAKTRGEPLELALDRVRHVAIGTMRHVAVSPKRVLVFGCARPVEETLLRDEDKRLLRVPAARDFALTRRDFLQRPAQVKRPSRAALRRQPRHRRGKRVIDFENARRVPEIFQPPAVTIGQLRCREPGKLPTGGIEQNSARRGQLAEIFDPAIGFNFRPARANAPQARR